MTSAINLSFRYTESDYVRALRAHFATHLRLRLDILVILVLIGASAYLWYFPDLHWMGVAGVVIAVAFATLLLAGFTVIPVMLFRREPKFRDDYSLEFSPEGIHFRTAHIDSNLQWTMYSRALVDAHSYILYYGSRRFTIIPKRVFPSADQCREFEQLLTERIPQIVRRGK